jgi:hypothetical protein
MRSNGVMRGAVRRSVEETLLIAAGGAMGGAVSDTLDTAVDLVVYNAVHLTVYRVVWWAVRDEPLHAALDDFLAAAGWGAP